MPTEIVTGTATKRITFQVESISVIIPVFNQQNKISFSLEKIKQAVESTFGNYELIVVNDGSTDKTLTILKHIENVDQHIHVLSHRPNRGKGYAVRRGVLHSHGNVVMFLDGDLDISPDSIKDYVERLNTCDLVIASKSHPKSNVSIPLSRLFLSRAFNLLVKVAVGIPQKDTQAGFKAGNGDVMRAIFRNASVNRYAFDVELLAIASTLHLKIQEMPVVIKIDRQLNMKQIVNMFTDVMRISYRHKILHAYEKELRTYLPVKLENNAS
jgi:glycosyltransferase involved in cell wall biosynthesis